MNSKSLLLLSLSLVFLTGCNGEEAPPTYENSYDPLTCLKSSDNCGVDWHFFFPKSGFPSNAQIAINDKIIIDDCDPQSYWSRGGDSRTVEFTVTDYANLSGSEKFSTTLYDRLDCSQQKVMKFFEAEQTLTVHTIDGVKQIWVEKK